MSKFQETINEDLNNIFFNTEEFASIHKIDNRELNIIIDNEEFVESQSKGYGTLEQANILYYVKASEYGVLPSEGAPQIFDGKMMKILSAREVDGIFEITLKQSRR